jgi:chromosome segregation ATPase
MTNHLRPNDVIEASQVVAIGRVLETLQREIAAQGEDLNEIGKSQAVVNTRLESLEERQRRAEDKGLEVRLSLAENEINALKEEARRTREERKDNKAHSLAFIGLIVAVLSLLVSATTMLPTAGKAPTQKTANH